MNKKRLSVVMAGAMLASSVAPVLAATGLHENGQWDHAETTGKKYTVNGANRGILVRDLRNLLKGHVYADEFSNYYLNSNELDSDGKLTSSAQSVAGTSVYAVRIISGSSTGAWMYDVTSAGIKALETALNNAKDGDVVEVLDRGHVVKNNKYYIHAQEDITISDATEVYTAKTLKEDYLAFANLNDTQKKANFPAIESMDYDAENNKLTVYTRAASDEVALKTIVLDTTKDRLKFDRPVDTNGDSLAGRTWNKPWNDLTGFEVVKSTAKIAKGEVIDGKTLAKVTVSDVDSEVVVKLSDLYDGLFLTDKGQELLAALKEFKENGVLKEGTVATSIEDAKNGIFTFGIEFKTYSAKKEGTRDKLIEKNLVTVSSNDKEQLELFRGWMENRTPLVDVLAGNTRYETAVKVAKENAHIKDVAKNGNIVLVNGDALVDGLAAAPLAAAAWNKNHGPNANGAPLDEQRVAPILLTESNSLPKATKEYIKELIAEQKVGQLNKVTVYLVGGEAVISKSLENQLKEYGLRVVRAGGANREETSLKVAEVILKDGLEANVDVANPFIVGANGEADAMSIAPVAAGAAKAKVNKRIRPIIVESPKGLSENALDTLKDWKNNKYDTKAISATIVGGKSVVSEATEEMLKDANVIVDRVEGSNRQATNAAVIDRYYKADSVKKIVVSKDGVARKDDLIDALTATSLAVKDNAPIVLGTNKLSEVQINALEKKATQTGLYVYQIGHGVARDVLKTIAERVGLAK